MFLSFLKSPVLKLAITQVDERYMIDLETHRNLHPENKFGQSELKDELGPEALAQDAPPDERFELLLPLTIKGYNFRTKKWLDLCADRVSDVKWNKEAFQNLVVDRKAKDLIRALVSSQLAAEKGTDLIMGKGNGLILLLHGGPGSRFALLSHHVLSLRPTNDSHSGQDFDSRKRCGNCRETVV